MTSQNPNATNPQSTQRPVRRGNSGCAWLFATVFICVLFTLLVPTVLVVTGVTTVSNILNGIGSILGIDITPETTAVVETPPSVVQSIQPLGQLVSLRTELAKADINVNVTAGVGGLCGYNAQYVAESTIEAGTNLSQLTEDNFVFDETRDAYVLTLPAPQLIGCHVDYIRQYSLSNSICGRDIDMTRMLAQYVAALEFRDEAVERGILERAEREARITIGSFLDIVSDEDIIIEFSPPDPDAPLPDSCQPRVPDGWSYNAETNAWEAVN